MRSSGSFLAWCLAVALVFIALGWRFEFGCILTYVQAFIQAGLELEGFVVVHLYTLSPSNAQSK